MDKEYLVKCNRAITDEMRGTLRDLGLAITYESKFLPVVSVKAMTDDIDISEVNDLAFVEYAREPAIGYLV